MLGYQRPKMKRVRSFLALIIYVRVSTPEQNVHVSFSDINKQIKVPTVRPSEMLRIKLKKEDIVKAK